MLAAPAVELLWKFVEPFTMNMWPAVEPPKKFIEPVFSSISALPAVDLSKKFIEPPLKIPAVPAVELL